MSNVSMIDGHIDNVVSDEDIVKALEDCVNKDVDCEDCSINDSCDGHSLEMVSRLVTVINRLKADKEALIKGQETLQKHLAEKNKENEILGKRIDGQKHALFEQQSYTAELQAEIERLKNAYKQCAWERDIFAEITEEEIKKDISILQVDINAVKSKAIKEFAEKLKEKSIYFPVSPCHIKGVPNIEIDNLVKEMESDEK